MAHEYQPPDRNFVQELARKNLPLSYSIAVGIALSLIAVVVEFIGFPIVAGLFVAMAVIFVLLAVTFVVIPLEILKFIK